MKNLKNMTKFKPATSYHGNVPLAKNIDFIFTSHFEWTQQKR